MCEKVVALGSGGIENYESQHRNSPACKRARESLLNSSQPKKPLPSILNWARPKAQPVRPIASPNVPHIPATAAQEKAVASGSRQPTTTLAKKLKRLADGLGDSIPEATEEDHLAIFAKNPKDFDRAEVASVDLWQDVLNDLLKQALDWGADRPVCDVLRRGQLGVEGLVWLVEYFVIERGVAECLFEGKLGLLMEEMEKW